jgi:DNA-binding transcriptional MerR regulator
MIQLPQKSHFKLDEVCGLTGVKPYVLRFWESEFPEIKPALSSSGQKLFSYRDVEVIYHIKELLFEQKLNIEQAKMKLAHTSINIVGDDHSKNHEINDNLKEMVDFEQAASESLSYDQSSLQKLLYAKEKLSSVLHLTQDIQARHHWG